jgi:hypothetical protein
VRVRVRVPSGRGLVPLLHAAERGVAVDVVAPPRAVQFEAEGFEKPLSVVEPDVGEMTLLDTGKELGRAHEAEMMAGASPLPLSTRRAGGSSSPTDRPR